jgi:hypothetical protein
MVGTGGVIPTAKATNSLHYQDFDKINDKNSYIFRSTGKRKRQHQENYPNNSKSNGIILKIDKKRLTFSCQCLGYHFSRPSQQ